MWTEVFLELSFINHRWKKTRKDKKRKKMSTKRFATDRRGKRFYIGSIVEYLDDLYYVDDMHFESWTRNQYLTIRKKTNKNKILEYISPETVNVKHG